jgi:4-aminobutyrate aminotransferase-like enzyme
VLDIGGYYKNVVTLAPNLLMSKDEMAMAIALLDQLLARVANA